MASNPELEAVISYAKSQNILIDFEEFKFQVETHPDYPTLLSFSDALSFFKIANVGAKIAKEDLQNMPDSFVAFLEPEQKAPFLSFIRRKNSNYFYTYEKETKKASKEELQSIWGDVILLLEKPENTEATAKKKSSLQSISFQIVATIITAFIFWFSQSFLALGFAVVTFAGIYFSIEALKTELGIESKVSQAFCNVIANADCGQVINSDKNSWLQKFKISDISIWFFTAQLFVLFLFSVFGRSETFFSLMLISLGLSLPLTFYSIYFQYKIEKKWCPICLTIIGLIYLQFFLLVLNHGLLALEVKPILLFIFGFLLMAIAVYFIKPLLLRIKDLNEKNIKNLRFKRNYTLFKNTLLTSSQQLFDYQYIILGNPNAPLKITIVTSPFCGYCKEAHEILHNIIEKHKDDIAISIRLNFKESKDEKTNLFYYRLVEIYQTKGDIAFSIALTDFFETKNTELWLSKYGEPKNETGNYKEILLKISDENISKKLSFTPNIFINQYQFPQIYERSDLEYFIADLIDDYE